MSNMLGLQGKSAKPTPRTTKSKPGSNNNSARANKVMSSREGGISRAATISGEKPEKLSQSASPYNSKMSTNLNPPRRVQSAAGIRSRHSMGPTVKASELFRKNSEPQLPKPNITATSSRLKSETLTIKPKAKHVRIDTDDGTSSPPSFKTRLPTTTLLFTEQSGSNTPPPPSNQRRRPFSFSTDRSVSANSAISNDSNDNDVQLFEPEVLTGEMALIQSKWKSKFESDNVNNSDNNSNVNIFNRSTSTDLHGRSFHPRLNKRTFSVDAFDYNDDYFQPQDFRMIEMKISEHPEESLKEENVSSGRIESRISGNVSPSEKQLLNRTFSTDPSDSEPDNVHCEAVKEVEAMKTVRTSADFDRLLLRQSDNILQGVSDLIDEIKSTGKRKSSISLLIRTDSVERLVDELKSEMKKSSFLASEEEDVTPVKKEMVDERFNFNCLDMSGIELADITCPQQVMDQSVPNSSRLDMSASEIFMGNAYSVTNEAENYTLLNSANSRLVEEEFDSSDSNNQTLSNSDVLSAIQVNMETEEGSIASTQSDFEVGTEEIERKISTALQMLEEEDRRFRGRLSGRLTSRSSLSPRRSLPPRAVSRGEEVGSCKSTPRIRSEERLQNRRATDSYPDKKKRTSGEDIPSGSLSARSRLMDDRWAESLNSARSVNTPLGVGRPESMPHAKSFNSVAELNFDKQQQPKAQVSNSSSSKSGDGPWETKDEKAKQIFSFLDEVEKTDQEMLFGLRFESDGLGRPIQPGNANFNGVGSRGGGDAETIIRSTTGFTQNSNKVDEKPFRTMDSLIRKGSVELAREILLLERKLDEGHHATKLLEESLLNQRELNTRMYRNSERDFKKRMKLQKEEFDLAFSRNEALINEMATEKRALQERLDKLIKTFEEMEAKHKEQTKSMQQKHLDEIKRLRKMQQSAESNLKQKLAGNKAQAHEIREMTVKGLEPEVQRIIQRHQQEMSEMRAWHSDEMRETEERSQRKLHMQLEDMREKMAKANEDAIMRERELSNRRLEAELRQKDDEIENLKRRYTNEAFEEKERAVSEELKMKDMMQEAIRKAQLKAEVELENLKKDYDAKLANLEKRYESELKSVKDIHEAEKQNLSTSQTKKLEHALSEQEATLRESFKSEKEKEWREKEKKLKDEFETFRRDDEGVSENRFRRMQEKFQSELNELEKTERDVKSKLTQAKSDLLAREEELFSLKTSLSMKDKQLTDLQEVNMKMQEERVNLTSVIRREFSDQINTVEEECRSLKVSIVEVQSNSKLQVEQQHLEMDKALNEKDAEIEKIGLRVKQALGRKDETILELQKQLEKCSFQITHLEKLLEEQRKEFLHSVKMPGSSSGGGGSRKK